MFYQLYDFIKEKYFEELQELPAATREALVLQKTLEEVPIAIKGADLISGWYGYEDEKAFAEAAGAAACKGTESGKSCAEGSEDDREFVFKDAYTEEDKKVLKALREDFVMWLGFGPGHTCIDYGYILKHGLISYEEKVRAVLSGLEGGKGAEKTLTEAEYGEKKIYLEAMLISLRAVQAYAGRFAALAKEQMQSAEGADAERLEKIYKTMSRVPYLPARDFHEALSAVWIMHSVIPISDNSWASISLGRMDQYLYPYYLKEIEGTEGDIAARDAMKACLKNFFLLLNAYGDGACALNVGGLDSDGKDQINDLSVLLIEVEKEMCMASPILAVRVHPEIPEEILDEVIDRKLFCIGQPTFYGELPCREAMVERGVPTEDAVSFSVNSCMGLFLSGEEVASMWGCVLNMHLPLEMAVNEGNPLFAKLPFVWDATAEGNCITMQTEASQGVWEPLMDAGKENQQPDSLDALWISYEKYLRALLVKLLKLNRKSELNFAVNAPNPLLSAITAGCVEKGLDRAVGAKYITETVETMAFANTANAIAAIDTLVFERRKYTLAQLKNAVQKDFAGEEEILADIRKCEKYGTNSEYADGICRHLCEITAKICKELSFGNVYYLPSMHTLDSNVSFGRDLYTTLDGRLKGEPVNKNAGPTNEVRSTDPTSLVLSAASLNQKLYSGGQPIDLYFAPEMLETKESRDKIKTLIKTYFQLGGLQMQVNSIDVELLEKAYERPQDYPILIVRIGGYSRPFCDLPRSVQREFIDRFRSESA